MKIEFTKMHGCGNDYVYIDGARFPLSKEQKSELAIKFSDRHFGIGGDGVIYIERSADADFEMDMYNLDGTPAEMCGNGIRCVAKFVYDKGLTDKKELSVLSHGKMKYLTLTVQETEDSTRGTVSKVRVNMGKPILEPSGIPVLSDKELVRNEPIIVDGKEYKITCVSMGNPHAVCFVELTEDFPMETIGPKFEHHEWFPKRTNTEFVEVLDRKNVSMRVWERGTGETLACGTGACATAVACILNGYTENAITVHLLGGDLEIEWDRDVDTVYMTGPATTVFEGNVQI